MDNQSIIKRYIQKFDNTAFGAGQIGFCDDFVIHLDRSFLGSSGSFADQMANAVLTIYIVGREGQSQSM